MNNFPELMGIRMKCSYFYSSCKIALLKRERIQYFNLLIIVVLKSYSLI